MKIAVIPIDNRPICYDLIKDVLEIKKDIELFIPPINFLGGLTDKSDIEGIFNFIKNLPQIDCLIVSLDTIAYGGLVSSRRCVDSFDEIKERIEKFKNIIQNKAKKILAFSSIMRISNNNVNEEEKEYWSQWGKRIFDWSYYLHKTEVEKSYNCVHNIIPREILDDYLKTRERNFEINKLYLKWAKEGFFDTLVFSKDDCAQYGLNVKEANILAQLIEKENIKSAKIKTGADEIPLSLITRAIAREENIKINPVFLQDKSTNLISKYEDISIKNCVLGQLELAGVKIDIEADLTLIINNFNEFQGDLVLGDRINLYDGTLKLPAKSYFIADVNNANGADCNFVEQLMKNEIKDFYGYCAYNTSANAIGCSIFCAVIKFLALKENQYNDKAFKKIQFIRLLDDWVYQAIVRKDVRESVFDYETVLNNNKERMNNYSKKVSAFLDFYPDKIEYSLPWKRSFEIRILCK